MPKVPKEFFRSHTPPHTHCVSTLSRPERARGGGGKVVRGRRGRRRHVARWPVSHQRQRWHEDQLPHLSGIRGLGNCNRAGTPGTATRRQTRIATGVCGCATSAQNRGLVGDPSAVRACLSTASHSLVLDPTLPHSGLRALRARTRARTRARDQPS